METDHTLHGGQVFGSTKFVLTTFVEGHQVTIYPKLF